MHQETLKSLSVVERVKSKYVITPENLPYFILPIVNYIHEFQPDCVIALDTGARIIGLAVFKLFTEMYGTFPTITHALLFRRVSHKISQELVAKQVKQDILSLLAQREHPRLFIVDDWTTTGKTTSVVKTMIDTLSQGKIDVRVGVMREFITNVADIHGDRFSVARSQWHHKSEKIGISYSPDLTPSPVRSIEAYQLRKQVIESIKNFARGMKEPKE